MRTLSYDDDPDTFGELSLPHGGRDGSDGPWPVAVLLHGGWWRHRHTLDLMRPLADDLTGRGWAAWNLEYRRVQPGSTAPWRTTLADVARGVDELARPDLDLPLDLDRVVFVGHSAGGHLALCTAARRTAVVRPALVVSLAGVHDPAAAAEAGMGEGAAVEFFGALPAVDPEPYRLAAPVGLVPIGVRQLLVHGDADARVPVWMSCRYREEAVAAGDDVELLELAGVDHMALIDPCAAAWGSTVERLPSGSGPAEAEAEVRPPC